MSVCISDDYELGYMHSIPFAGFISCESGNPLALQKVSGNLRGGMPNLKSFAHKAGSKYWPKRCPEGFSQHLWHVHDGCAIHYCVKANVLNQLALPNIRRPPFNDVQWDKISDELHGPPDGQDAQ